MIKLQINGFVLLQFFAIRGFVRTHPQQVLWDYVQKYVDGKSGYLIADDTIMDKPRGPKIEGLFWKAQTFGKGAVSGQFGEVLMKKVSSRRVLGAVY